MVRFSCVWSGIRAFTYVGESAIYTGIYATVQAEVSV